ncbi:MAG: M14 family metallopeptidase [Elusimicrobia bacterium]|nr:M14 family metallopeptidase [Elusimicrobiota bacterium]
MKKLALILLLFGLCAHNLKAEEPKQSNTTVSFNQLLGQLVASSLGNINIPEPVLDKDAQAAINADDRYWVTVLASDKYERTKLLDAGMDIVEVKKDKVSGFVNKKTLDTLSEKGFVVESKMTMAQYVQQFGKDFPAADSAYHNYKETTDLLKTLASNNSTIASLFSIGKTIEGRDIWCLRINTNAKGEGASTKPGAVFIGNHHAREHLSNEVPLLFASWLFDHKGDADVKKYIDSLDIYIIPMLNPDGVEYDIKTGKYQWQRKNMRVNSDKSIGVDLNRNYDSWFGGEGASHSPNSDTYCGPSAFSEPETTAIKKFVLARKNLKTLNSYHSYADTIMYPWGGKDGPIDSDKDKQVFIKMANEMAKDTGYTAEQSNEMYIATGDACDWAYDVAKIFAFTTELGGNSFYPGAGIIAKTVTDNIKAAVYMLSMTENPYKTIN